MALEELLDRGTGFNDNVYNEQKCIYDENNGVGMQIYSDDMKSALYMREGLYNRYGRAPRTIFVPKENYDLAGGLGYDMTNRFLKFSLYLVTEFEGKRDTLYIPELLLQKWHGIPSCMRRNKNMSYGF